MGLQFKQALANSNQVTYLKTPPHYFFSAQIKLGKNGYAGVHFGVSGRDDGGWALMINRADNSVHFMEVKKGGGVLLDRGQRKFDFDLDTWYPIRGQYDGKILKLWFNQNPLDTDPWPKYEFELDIPEGIGLDSGDAIGEFKDISIKEFKSSKNSNDVPTFTNPIITGADPDILLHEGTYYLYNRVPNDPNSAEDAYLYRNSEEKELDEIGNENTIFRVASSCDLINWSPYKIALKRNQALAGAFCMSPNVFYKEGWFYLLFAAGRFGGEENFRMYYAVSKSPLGPFEMNSTSPLHSTTDEIGGMPFIDEDGQCYITYVRFDRGNHIYLQRLQVGDGKIVPEEATLVHVLSPTAQYETDDFGGIVEGGVIIPHKGMYYMIYADGHYMGHYGESYALADHIYGPYIRHPFNPILHHHFKVDGAGDGIVVYNKDKSQMYMGYHRHVKPGTIEPRMTCLDKMKFVSDPKGGPDILTVYGPTTTPQPYPFLQKNNSDKE